MLTDYIRAAMREAKYEILEDDGTFYGEITGFQGVWANSSTLEGWIVLSLSKKLPLPTVNGISLEIASTP